MPCCVVTSASDFRVSQCTVANLSRTARPVGASLTCKGNEVVNGGVQKVSEDETKNDGKREAAVTIGGGSCSEQATAVG